MMKLKKEKCYFNPDFFAVEPVLRNYEKQSGLVSDFKKKTSDLGLNRPDQSRNRSIDSLR
jgi:hypothetical protein